MLLDSYPRLTWGGALVILALGIIASLTLASQVWAHKVNVFAWVEGETVFVEGYYPGGKKAQNSLVEIYNSTGAKLLEGRTNQKGEFSFKIPAREDLRIVLTAGMGHKNDFTITAGDLGGSEPSSDEPLPKTREKVAAPSSTTVDMGQLEQTIDQALDRKLEPLIKLIRNTRKEGPGVTEIIGGIGYIFGLFGLVMYFRDRKKGSRDKTL
jgi:nickel transport protein